MTDLLKCPTVSSCPASHPTKCSDGSCKATIDDCPDTVNCPNSLPYLCSDLTCKATLAQCSKNHQCSEGAPFKVWCIRNFLKNIVIWRIFIARSGYQPGCEILNFLQK